MRFSCARETPRARCAAARTPANGAASGAPRRARTRRGAERATTTFFRKPPTDRRPGRTVRWSRTPTTSGGPRAGRSRGRRSRRPKAPPKAPPGARGKPAARRPPAPAPAPAPAPRRRARRIRNGGEVDRGGGVGSAPRASRGVRGSGRGREARARAREDGAGRAGEDQGAAGAGVGSIRRAIVSIGSFSSKKKMGSHAFIEDTFSFSPEVPSRWPAQSSPRGRKAAGGAGIRYRPRREGDARGVSVGVAAEDPGSC